MKVYLLIESASDWDYDHYEVINGFSSLDLANKVMNGLNEVMESIWDNSPQKKFDDKWKNFDTLPDDLVETYWEEDREAYTQHRDYLETYRITTFNIIPKYTIKEIDVI